MAIGQGHGHRQGPRTATTVPIAGSPQSPAIPSNESFAHILTPRILYLIIVSLFALLAIHFFYSFFHMESSTVGFFLPSLSLGVLPATTEKLDFHLLATWSKARACTLIDRGSHVSHYHTEDPFFPTTAASQPPIHLLLISVGNTTSQGAPSQAGVCGFSDPPRTRVSSVATRLYPDASQLLASATGPPKMIACGDTAQTLDLAFSQASAIGRMKLSTLGKPAWPVRGAFTHPGLASVL